MQVQLVYSDDSAELVLQNKYCHDWSDIVSRSQIEALAIDQVRRSHPGRPQ